MSSLFNCCKGEDILFETKDLIGIFARGTVSAAGVISNSVNMTSSFLGNTAQGSLYQVTFNTPHPLGTDYQVGGNVFDVADGDSASNEIVDGSKTANGFQYLTNQGDNGGTQDPALQAGKDIIITGETCEVLTGGTGSTNTRVVDATFDATFSFEPIDIHNNGVIVQLVDKVLDFGFSRVSNIITYNGTPEKINIDISLNAADLGASSYWGRPKIRVIRNGNIIAVFDDLAMQQTGTYNGDATITGSFVDKNPPANPSYTFEWFDEENRTATLIPESFSQLSLVATNKITVLQA